MVQEAVPDAPFASVPVPSTAFSPLKTGGSTLTTLKANLATKTNDDEGADYSTVMLEYSSSYTALQASLSATSKVISTSLLDYLS